MPVYNEAANLDTVLGQVRERVLDMIPGSELIVVDDRSTDTSPHLLAVAAAHDPRITVLTNDANRGHGPSVRAGWQHAEAPWILTLDSDGQVDLSSFPQLWEVRDQHDLVLGARVGRHDPAHRKLVTLATRVLAGAVARRGITDANTPFKLIRGSLWDHVGPAVPYDAFAPTVLLVVAAIKARARVTEVPVVQLPRLHGRSTLKAGTLAKALFQCTRETFGAARAPISPYSP